MPTYQHIRETITSHLDDAFRNAFPNIPIEYENRDAVDRETQIEIGPFIELAIRFHEAEQVSLGTDALTRTIGDVVTAIYVPLGSGVAKALELADWIKQRLQRQQLGAVRLLTAQLLGTQSAPGYHVLPIAVPFWCDSVG